MNEHARSILRRRRDSLWCGSRRRADRSARLLISVLGIPATAQWLDHRDARTPRGPDGSADLNARAPRTADDKPDLSGIWQPASDPTGRRGGIEGIIAPRYLTDITLPAGVPRLDTYTHPYKIVQTPELIVMLYESLTMFRQIFLDGSGHPHSDNMRLTERFVRHNFGHMDIEITVDDPVLYTKPLRYTQPQKLLPDTDLLEYVCDNLKELPRTR